ncbi:hypothetical protein IV203_004692 [Nitzschia inconspicua]|uniref:Uncharacterized protein n=1 Tax=Nitzschia inconspicua TaxID=303405 RepID=A0A9K3L5S4_9STRA|nr:hypothetical protein IV203_004692 [Nitzschia inconspicua]
MATYSSDEDDDNLSDAEVVPANVRVPVVGELQHYMEDDDTRDPAEATSIMITLCFAYIPDFSTDVLPFNHKIFDNNKRQHKPSLQVLKDEIKRRDPSLRGYKNKPLASLLQYKTACENRIKDSTQAPDTSTGNGTTTRITIDDRLRLIEAFLSDKAKGKLASTQQCLTRQELDARNSDLAVEDYFETVSQVFNDESWTPTTESLPDLHPDLADARDLPLKEYRTTRAKVKEKYNEMRHYLHAIVLNWEQSGNGGQQRSDDAEDWDTFDPLLVVDGDDRKNFLP